MSAAAHSLMQQFLAWVAEAPRSYADAEAWRRSCPHFAIWEDAISDGLVRLERRHARWIAAGVDGGRTQAVAELKPFSLSSPPLGRGEVGSRQRSGREGALQSHPIPPLAIARVAPPPPREGGSETNRNAAGGLLAQPLNVPSHEQAPRRSPPALAGHRAGHQRPSSSSSPIRPRAGVWSRQKTAGACGLTQHSVFARLEQIENKDVGREDRPASAVAGYP